MPNCRHQGRTGTRLPTQLALLLGLTLLLSTCGTAQRKAPPKPPDYSLPAPRGCHEPIVGVNQQLTEQVGESNLPRLAWDGRNFTIAWWEMRSGSEIYTVRIDKNGIRRSRDNALPNERASKFHTVAWDGQQTHIVWSDGGLIKSQRFGKVVAPPTTLAAGGQAPRAGPWGSAVWINRGRLFFRSDGIPEKQATKHEGINGIVVAAGGISDPALSWTGDMYSVAWSISEPGGRRIVLQRLAHDGIAIGPRINVSENGEVGTQPEIAWSGESFGLAWLREVQDPSGMTKYQVSFARVPKMAVAPTVVAELDLGSDVQGIALASSGKEFAIAWTAPTENRNTLIHMQRVSLQGELLEPRLTISDGQAFYSSRPDIAWAEEGYGIVWHDDRAATGNEIFFSYVQCGPEPTDESPGQQDAETDTIDSDSDTGADQPTDETNQPQPAPTGLKPVFDE